MAVMASRIDVSIEHRAAPDGQPAQQKRNPNTCPRCSSHYRDDELDATLRVCAHCDYHFQVKARDRIGQLVDRGTFVEEFAGVRSADLTLHVGLGTFKPIATATVEEHPIHREIYELSAATQAAALAPAAGTRRIAVGTTSVRTL